MNLLELTAAILGLACVWLTARQHIACWPVGLLMVTLYAYIFYQAKLYSDALLQIVYIGLQLYGWWAWLYGGHAQSELHVTRLSARQMIGCCAVLIGGFFVARLRDGLSNERRVSLSRRFCHRSEPDRPMVAGT